MSKEQRDEVSGKRDAARRAANLNTLTPHMLRVLNYLQEQAEPQTAPEIAKALGMNRNAVVSVLGGLYIRNKVTRIFGRVYHWAVIA